MKKIVIANNKGGVGKTTIASQLAYKLARSGHSVVTIDLDTQGNLSSTFAGAKQLGSVIDIVTTGNPPPVSLNSGEIGLLSSHPDINDHTGDETMALVRDGIKSLEGADYCIIDSPPTFSKVVYGALLAADYLLVPIELKKYSLDGIENILSTYFQIKELNGGLELLGLLPSRFDAVKEMERKSLEAVIDTFGSVLIPHAIRNRVAYEQAQSGGLSVDMIKTKSGKDCNAEFIQFYDWFLDKVA